jgi:hypothetical protein
MYSFYLPNLQSHHLSKLCIIIYFYLTHIYKITIRDLLKNISRNKLCSPDMLCMTGLISNKQSHAELQLLLTHGSINRHQHAILMPIMLISYMKCTRAIQFDTATVTIQYLVCHGNVGFISKSYSEHSDFNESFICFGRVPEIYKKMLLCS